MTNWFSRILGAVVGVLMFGGIATAIIQNNAPQGPWLGDSLLNFFTVWQAITYDNQVGYTNITSISQTSGQANCTQLSGTTPMTNLTSTASAGTGYICMPTATAGREYYIGNATGQTINIYGSATTAVVGTQDTINGTTGTSAYGGLTSGKNANCFAPANGTWYCTAGN
jgi:hypothetical protein